MLFLSLSLICLTVISMFILLNRVRKLERTKEGDQSLLLVQQQISQIAGQLTNQLNSVTAQVNQRLKENVDIFGTVQNSLGVLQNSIKKFDETYKQLDDDIAKFQSVLQPPAFRGGIGELLLENLLKQILPPEHFKLQHKFKNGKEVDAAIILGGRLVPVDSKFPMDNFKRMLSSSSEEERNRIKRDFIRDMKNHIDAIATKYILPDEGTFDFALMYIPAENVYYEVIIKSEAIEGPEVLSYAHSKKVIPVSPNSFYAYLQTILLGLKGMQVNKRAQEIVTNIMRLQGDLDRFKDDFRVLGSHIKNTREKYEEAEKKLERFTDKLSTVHQTKEIEELS